MTEQIPDGTAYTQIPADLGPGALEDRSVALALLSLHYPAHLGYSDPDYPTVPVLTLETQQGQTNWHIPVGHTELFAHVRFADRDEAMAASAGTGHDADAKRQTVRTRINAIT